MYTVEIENVGDSSLENSNFPMLQEFENREDAYMKAKVLECKLNQELFSDYYYEAVDYEDKIIIHATLRPEDEEDLDDDLNLEKLLAKAPQCVHFDGKANPEDSN